MLEEVSLRVVFEAMFETRQFIYKTNKSELCHSALSNLMKGSRM